MRILRTTSLLCLALLLGACRHPLKIVGAGDIVDVSGGERGCTLEQFQRKDPACSHNRVDDDYRATYEARPHPGWRFAGWANGCQEELPGGRCRFDVPASSVQWWRENRPGEPGPALVAVFEAQDAGRIDLAALPNYANQEIPYYISRDNTADNPVSDAGATLGRVLFYDKQLSSNRRIACASCHRQGVAFSDPRVFSRGVNGLTTRHSPRLVNARFSLETAFFWDERAASLEEQASQPIVDHTEMGFSGKDGAPDLADLLARMEGLAYYPTLFSAAFGDERIDVARMELALAQFVRSIQSFDSKYDRGLTLAGGDLDADFPNFTEQENHGKFLFMRLPLLSTGENLNGDGSDRGIVGVRRGGGLGCIICHSAPEFSINPTSRNNGVTSSPEGGKDDFSVTRSPSLRDLFSPAGRLNTPLMHDGSMQQFNQVLDHYNRIDADLTLNPGLDTRLSGRNAATPGEQLLPGRNSEPGPGQQLMMTPQERAAITAFMQTLTGRRIYRDARWASPFAADGSLEVVAGD